MPHVVGGRFKMAPSREATLLRFSIKSAPSPLPKKSPLHPSCLISLASFKAIKASILYMDRKEPHFFCLTLTVHGKMYFGYENIWKECFQDLCHCALFTSQMLSQECVQTIKTMSPCVGILQSPWRYCRNVFLPFLTFKTMPYSLQVKIFLSREFIHLWFTESGVCLDLFGVLIF